MFYRTFAAAALMGAVSASAASFSAGYDTVAGATVPGPVIPNLTAGDISRGSGLLVNSGGDYNSRDWTQGGDLATAITNGDYVEFTFEPAAGYEMDITSIEAAWDRSGTGPATMALVSTTDNFANFTVIDTFSAPTSVANFTFSPGIVDATGPITFAFAGWGATSSSGTADLETDEIAGQFGLVVDGDVSLIPEPASIALLGLGGLFLRRRR